MKKIFIDANVALDYIEGDSKGHASAREAINIIRHEYGKPYITPSTVTIIWYYMEKAFTRHLTKLNLSYKDAEKKRLRKNVESLLHQFWFIDQTRVNVEQSILSEWGDIEDSIQYHAAKSAGMDIIITNDHNDFWLSEIDVYSSSNFVSLYLGGRLFGR